LSQRNLDILRHILSAYGGRIERVALFGSRATGTHKPGPDIDLVVYGVLEANDLARLRDELSDSSLSLHADLQLYSSVALPALSASIDRHACELLSQADLLVFAA